MSHVTFAEWLIENKQQQQTNKDKNDFIEISHLESGFQSKTFRVPARVPDPFPKLCKVGRGYFVFVL